MRLEEKFYMKKLLCSMLFVASLGVSGSAFAHTTEYTPELGDPSKVTVTSNSASKRAAYVHNSQRVIANDGSYGYTHAFTYDGNTIYYLKASIRATYSNGQVSGGSGSNPNTSNLSHAYSTVVYENGPKRQYHSNSEAKNTSTSATEYLSGSSSIFN